MNSQITIRNAKPGDFDAIITLDEAGPKEDKTGYWRGILEHYVIAGRADRIFLVAEMGDSLVGFIVGEVRAWEFGSPPCGWVFALTVAPVAREMGIGKQMFDEICKRLKK